MNLNIANVSGLPAEESEALRRLIQVWDSKRSRNQLRYDYYNGKNVVKNLGISVPDDLRSIDSVVGWPAKAVDNLAVRSRFDGFTFEGEEDKDIQEIVSRSRLRTLYQQTCQDELISSCAFMTVSAGKDGESPAIISAYSALFAAAEWDRRAKRIKYGLAVIDTKKNPISDDEEPVWVNLFTDTATWEIKKTDKGWTSRKNEHEMGRPMMEPFVYRPTLDRPFGKSRISRAVMSITDNAVREVLRSEIHAEFYTSPQKYILGVDEDFLDGQTKWDAYIGAIMALSPNEEGDIPSVGMFSQGSMQPHIDYMRSLAARFSGETSIPVSELGVIHDNPASAEAIYAAKESLVCEAEALNEINGDALAQVAKMALACAKNVALEDLDDNAKSVMPRFKNPAKPSTISQVTSMQQAIQALPWIADSDVAIEEMGFSDEQIRRLKEDKKKSEATAVILQQLTNRTKAKQESDNADNSKNVS